MLWKVPFGLRKPNPQGSGGGGGWGIIPTDSDKRESSHQGPGGGGLLRVLKRRPGWHGKWFKMKALLARRTRFTAIDAVLDQLVAPRLAVTWHADGGRRCASDERKGRADGGRGIRC